MIGLLHRSSPHRTIGLITLTVAVLVGATVALVVHGTSASSSSLTAADRALLYQAEQTAIQNCLRDKGFRYWPEPQPSASVSNRFPYVIDDVAWARANGFGSR